MKICIIYRSETGSTPHVAQYLASVCRAERLTEVLDHGRYGHDTRSVSQCSKSQSEDLTPISSSLIDDF